MDTLNVFNNIRPGDRVTIRTPQGQHVTGRAVICSQARYGTVALNMGGRYGRPGVATAQNLVAVKTKK